MQEESFKCLLDYSTPFHKSLKELKEFSSQLYHAADYCESTFLNAEDKRNAVDTTKEYVSRAVVAIVDHIGSISANLEHCILKTNSIPQTEHKIDCLKQRLAIRQQYTHMLASGRFYLNANFSRYHCRYIRPPLTDSARMNARYRESENRIDDNSGKQVHFEAEEPLFFYTYNCKPSLTANSHFEIEKKNLPPVLPVRDRWSVLPKSQNSMFQFQEAQKLKCRSLNRKIMQNREISSLIRRGKRILT